MWCEDALHELVDDQVSGVGARATGETRQSVRYEELTLFIMGALL